MLLAESLLGSSSVAANYIEDVFSTYLYTGNDSTQNIVNGIDLSGKGGLVWGKSRNDSDDHNFYDTARGVQYSLSSNLTEEQVSRSNSLTAFNNNGYTLGSNTSDNYSARTYTSWTFRKQAKFFDVVTYTGNGTNRTIAHNLGSVPGCIIVKDTSNTRAWAVYHVSLGNTKYLILNGTDAEGTSASLWNSTTPTSTDFSLGISSLVNASGATYVAYLFAHDAGGFGLTGTDNVISCGSWTDSGSGTQTITLGYEPQFLIYKRTDASSNWVMLDTMRGWPVVNAAGSTANLYPNLSNAESGGNYAGNGPTATGFTMPTLGGGTYIYIAIRRGPMKTPTTGTSVFAPTYGDNNGVAPAFITNFPVDLGIVGKGTSGTTLNRWAPRLTETLYLSSPTTDAEVTGSSFKFDFQNGWLNATTDFTQAFSWNFRRAPGFFDVVCYTGTGANRTVSHNLGVVPELMINKKRSGAENWFVYSSATGNTKFLQLQATDNAQTDSTYWNNTSPTSSVFTVGTGSTNDNAATYVTYLFATVAGVSKVGSYTGTGTTKQIDCGFTGGARFVLIKRTDSTGDWYVWDSARGIVAGNDPYLLLNSTAAEVTSTDYVDTYSAGFEISSTAPAAINANGGSYIFLAIA